MKAVVKYAHGVGNIEVREVDEPDVAPDQVLLEVKAAGICGTDLHIYHGTWPLNPPVVLGHEFCGEIVKTGKKVRDWHVGDRVIPEPHAYVCGKCHFCKGGDYNLCPERKAFGYLVNGGFTKYVSLPTRVLHRIPEKISYEEAALTEPASGAFHAIAEKAQIKFGDIVVVLGPGPIGLLMLQITKAQGAGRVIVAGLGVDKKRLKVARQLGADVVNIEEEDPVKKVRELSIMGADVVLEASGSSVAVRLALELVRKKGRIILFGIHRCLAELDLNKVIFSELVTQGSFGHTWIDFERALDLMSKGKIQTKPIITHKFPITEWEKGFKLIEENRAIKVLLIPVD